MSERGLPLNLLRVFTTSERSPQLGFSLFGGPVNSETYSLGREREMHMPRGQTHVRQINGEKIRRPRGPLTLATVVLERVERR